MSEERNPNENSPHDLRFGLLIKQGNEGIKIRYENHGINIADIILILETCSERIKKQYLGVIKDSFGK